MKEVLSSRFFKWSDRQAIKVIFEIPSYWWSRPFEYAWAIGFAGMHVVALDAACGIHHPFKFALFDICKKVCAVDIDPRINDEKAITEDIYNTFGPASVKLFNEKYRQMEMGMADIRSLPYKWSVFDRVFCISTLEHMDRDGRIMALREFKRVLKPDGLLLITADYPTLDPAIMAEEALNQGFAFAGDYDLKVPSNAISVGGELHCYRMALKIK
jgi:SAM-dependent methyltransferase